LQKQISLLEKIQKIDLKILEIETKSKDFPAEIERFQEEVESEKESLKELEDSVAELEKRRMALEGEVELTKEKIKVWQNQLSQAKGEKEYRALLKEIDGGKKENDKREEEILEIMEKIEEGKRDLKENEQILNGNLDKFEDIRKENEEKMQIMGKELNEIQKSRSEIAHEIKPDYLRKYESIRRGRKKIAVVPARDGTCLGCHMSLPPQTFIHVLKKDMLVDCPFCHRILFWKEEKEPV
jgi:predicted  nucleic acid-binding Zn-ribbon protein